MIEALIKLLKVKTIVTILVTVVFCYLSCIGTVTSSEFITIFTVIIGFYFGTQYEKEKPKE